MSLTNRFAGFIFFIGLFLCPSPVLAATMSLSVSDIPPVVDQFQEFEVEVTLVCGSCADSYLRPVLYPSGTKYFGYAKNNSGTWTNVPGASCTEYFRIASAEISEGSWSGKLKVKADVDSPYYDGPGEYFFKIGRYTSSCGSPSLWSSETSIAITGPSPTNTPTPTTGVTSTSTPSPTTAATPSPTDTYRGETMTLTPTPHAVKTKNKPVTLGIAVVAPDAPATSTGGQSTTSNTIRPGITNGETAAYAYSALICAVISVVSTLVVMGKKSKASHQEE